MGSDFTKTSVSSRGITKMFKKIRGAMLPKSLLIVFLLPFQTAIGLPEMSVMLINVSKNVPVIWQLVKAFAFLVGSFFIFRALIKLKIYGEMRSMMAPHARLNQIIIFLFSGTLLMYLSTATLPVMLDAMFGSPIIKELAYDNMTTSMSLEVQKAAKRIVQLIGLISLLRGIMQLTGQQESGGRHPMSKAVTHIISGVLAINIQQTTHLVQSILGI